MDRLAKESFWHSIGPDPADCPRHRIGKWAGGFQNLLGGRNVVGSPFFATQTKVDS